MDRAGGPPIGDQELGLLRFVTEAGSATAGEVAEQFGAPQGLSRSTVVTVLERLRKKGYLARRRQSGVFRYSSVVKEDELMRGVVHRFVEKTLAGSLRPFAAYFARSDKLNEDETRELERLIKKLEGAESRGDDQPMEGDGGAH